MTLMCPLDSRTSRGKRSFLNLLFIYPAYPPAKPTIPKRRQNKPVGFSPNLGSAMGRSSGSGVHSPAWPMLDCVTLSSLFHLPELWCLLSGVEQMA